MVSKAAGGPALVPIQPNTLAGKAAWEGLGQTRPSFGTAQRPQRITLRTVLMSSSIPGKFCTTPGFRDGEHAGPQCPNSEG